ncbi:MAG: hypothetical protein ABR909_00005 [Candidatus Bathyarchaeia archaeon]
MVTISRSKVSAGIAVIVILVIVFIFSCTCPNLQAQTDVFFSPADKFSIPAYNGTISFAVNGAYSEAIFENGSWTFMNLRLNGSLPIENLEFSAQNCNVTIFSYQSLFNTTAFNILLLSYVVEGQGKQILNLGLGSQEGGLSTSAEWNVIFGNRALTDEGDGWNLLPDGTLIVTGASENENVTILHYVFSDSFENNSNLPFYQQHSVAIIAAIAVAVTVAIAVVIKVRTREHSGELMKST